MLNGVGYKGRRRLEESVLMARDQHIIDTTDINHQTKAYEDNARRVFDAEAAPQAAAAARRGRGHATSDRTRAGCSSQSEEAGETFLMPWITLEDSGQHVFIGPGGGFQPGGPGSKAKFLLSKRTGSQGKLGLKGGQSGAQAIVDKARAGPAKAAQPTALQHQAAAMTKARGKLQAAQGKEVGRIAQVQQNPTKFAQPGDVAQVKVEGYRFRPRAVPVQA